MTQQDAINLVKRIIQGGLRHANYDRTVELAELYKAFITGEGIEKHIVKFSRREDEEALKQRIEITSNITETVCAAVIDPQFKLPRSNSIERRLSYLEPDDKKYDQLVRIISSFFERNRSVDDYMGSSWIELTNIDPNAFVVLDWKKEKVDGHYLPYPVEYPSASVYNYNKVGGVLNWILVHREEELPDPEMYILYTPDFTITFSRKRDYADKDWEKNVDVKYFVKHPIKDFTSGLVAILKDKDDYYDVNLHYPHKLGVIPGFFVGFVNDLVTRTTYVSAIHKAFPILKKILKINSELDLTTAFHAFPQKIQYARPCPECRGNLSTIEGNVCPNCNGLGIDPKDTHTSAQDVIKIPMPRDQQDMFDLSKIIHYVNQDVQLSKFQEEYLFKLIKWCKEAVYNSEAFTRGQVAETAYSKNADIQNVYDALWPMAKAYANRYNFIVDTLSKITDLDKGLIHNLSFRKDFKMKSLTDLYNDRSIVTQADCDEFVKKSIEDDIAQILYEDDPRELVKYRTMVHFFPFNGKTSAEIKTIIATPNLTTEEIKVLWANFAYVFDELELEQKKANKDFYRMPREVQKELLDKKVAEIIKITKKQEEITLGEDLQRTQGRDRQTEREARKPAN